MAASWYGYSYPQVIDDGKFEKNQKQIIINFL
jgi:hypothetical protein